MNNGTAPPARLSRGKIVVSPGRHDEKRQSLQANHYMEDTMKRTNRHAAFSMSAVLAATVVMLGFIRSSDYLRWTGSAAFAAEQEAPGALQWRQTAGPEGATILTLLADGPTLFAGTSVGGVF